MIWTDQTDFSSLSIEKQLNCCGLMRVPFVNTVAALSERDVQLKHQLVEDGFVCSCEGLPRVETGLGSVERLPANPMADNPLLRH